MNAININQDRLMALVGMAMSELSGANGGVMISVGNKLGLYKAMAGRGPMFPADLAKRAGCAERYVREWLNCNAAGGYVLYHPETQQYELSPEQAMMLADDTSPVFIPNAWEVTASMWFDEAKTIEAFPHRQGHRLGRPPRAPLLRRRGLFPQRLCRVSGAGLAAGADRHGAET